MRKTVKVCTTSSTLDALANNIFNDVIYPDFTKKPAERPALKFQPLEPYQAANVEGYRVVALPVKHAVPAVGYEVTSAEGKSFFFSGGTGPDCPPAGNI